METLYTARLQVFTNLSRVGLEPAFTRESIFSLLIVLGSSLSLVALVFAFITYSLFSDLKNLSGTTLMNLLSSLFMSQLLYVVGVGGVSAAKIGFQGNDQVITVVGEITDKTMAQACQDWLKLAK